MDIKCFLLVPTGKERERKVKFDDGREFTAYDTIYKRRDTGEEMTLHDAPVGAIWENTWYEDDEALKCWCGPDGKSFTVRTPGGDWHIDGRASNCDKPNDHVHKCWCRHGEAPNLTVNKIGNTCNAGAGSILQGNYHGFLANGKLTDC
jgi:hypothetical protein